MLKFDAARLMKAALAGTATKRFTDVIEGAFEGVDPEALHKQLDVEEEEEDEDYVVEKGLEEQTDDTPTSSTAPATRSKKRKATTPPKTSAAKSAKNKGVCALSDAADIFPTMTDKQKGYLHSGVDDKFISDRQSSMGGKSAGYGCEYSNVMKQEGHIVKDCDFISTVRGQLSTHMSNAPRCCCFLLHMPAEMVVCTYLDTAYEIRPLRPQGRRFLRAGWS